MPIISYDSNIHLDIKVISQWLNEYRYNLNTYNNYRNIAHYFIVWLIEHNLSVKSITRTTIHNYQDYLIDFLKNSTINLHITVLGSMFQYLINIQYIYVNPFRLRKQKLPVKKKLTKYLTISDWEILLNFIDNPQTKKEYRSRWIFLLLYYTGCRRSEVVNAKMIDVTIKRTGWWITVAGKGNKTGSIPMPNILIVEFIKYRNSLSLPDIPQVNETNPLISSISDPLLSITASTLYRIIKKTTRKLSEQLKEHDPVRAQIFKDFSPHWLRHTSATHQFEYGIDLRTIKENLRHSNIQTTLSYSHLDQDKQHSETVEKFGN
ncbi:MAG: hypothetical protein EKK54_06340 [Neisseriaceae bacterium]|nr:MAG: hypothetical protein EKK54_06340 [Neisseriaceae bacterium]